MRTIVAVVMGLVVGVSGAQSAAPYLKMAPLAEYMIADRATEVALARSAAPEAISRDADVMVLGKNGYMAAVHGTNGFVCIVERGWGAATDDENFWNQKVRAPHCFNPQAASSFLPIYLMKTKLILAGKSKAELLHATETAFAKGELPKLEPGAMVYMMSKQQYLTDRAMNWHPHVMFYVAGSAEKNWGANLEGSPVIAANDPQEHATIFLVMVGHWSDGSPGPKME